ncbi:MAG: AEC family transporter [Christensenellaceae bacterium]|jgi:predicted permease|nr:AEC family transporter [Christensenellaceae bacterium]
MFIESFENIGLMLLMAIPGFIIAKLKMIDSEKSIKFISVLLLYVCQPFVTFDAFLNTPFNEKILLNMAICFLLTAILIVLTAIISKIVLRVTSQNNDMGGVLSYASSFGNIGYLCVPFLQILAPGNSEIMVYASAAIVAFNILAWTFGNYLITKDKKHVSIKNIILNPATLAFLIALPFFLLNLNFTRAHSLAGLQKIISLMGNLVGPLAMLMVGICFANFQIRKSLSESKLLYPISLALVIKLIITPLLAFALLKLISVFYNTTSINLNILALASMPAANNLIMFCSLANRETQTPTSLVLLSTLISAITIPVFLNLLLLF